MDVAGCRDWGYALKGVLELHRKVARRQYDDGFEAGARACGPMCNRAGELKMAQLAAEIFEAGETMRQMLPLLRALTQEKA